MPAFLADATEEGDALLVLLPTFPFFSFAIAFIGLTGALALVGLGLLLRRSWRLPTWASFAVRLGRRHRVGLALLAETSPSTCPAMVENWINITFQLCQLFKHGWLGPLFGFAVVWPLD